MKDKKLSTPSALDDLIVADFTQLAQGPWATQMLGDMGADVIKIEPPKGDWMRNYAYGNMYSKGESISFLSFNRNKRSITLDLKSDKGYKAAKKIVAQADVLIENFRPGVMKRLGLGYNDIKKINPELIYCSSSGYGPDGPYVSRPGQDLLAQAMSGAAYLNGKKGDIPVATAVGQADLLTSLFIVQSVLAALHYRTRTGKGQKIEACLLNSIIAFHTQEVTAFLAKGEQPERSTSGIPNPWIGAPYGIYETKDGHIAIGMNSVRKLAGILGLDKYDNKDFESNNVIENRDQIRDDFNNMFKNKSTDAWLEILLEYDIWCSQVNSFQEMVTDPQVKHNNMIIDYHHEKAGKISTPGFAVKFGETPMAVSRPSPSLGEHTKEILRDVCDFSDEEIKNMESDN